MINVNDVIEEKNTIYRMKYEDHDKCNNIVEN